MLDQEEYSSLENNWDNVLFLENVETYVTLRGTKRMHLWAHTALSSTELLRGKLLPAWRQQEWRVLDLASAYIRSVHKCSPSLNLLLILETDLAFGFSYGQMDKVMLQKYKKFGQRRFRRAHFPLYINLYNLKFWKYTEVKLTWQNKILRVGWDLRDRYRPAFAGR